MLSILVIAIPAGLLTLLCRFLLSRYWLSRIRPYLTIGLTTIALIAVLYLNLFSFGFAYLWRFDPIISDCGGFGVAECPSTSPSQWELKANNYYAWMLTPPSLRPKSLLFLLSVLAVQITASRRTDSAVPQSHCYTPTRSPQSPGWYAFFAAPSPLPLAASNPPSYTQTRCATPG